VYGPVPHIKAAKIYDVEQRYIKFTRRT